MLRLYQTDALCFHSSQYSSLLVAVARDVRIITSFWGIFRYHGITKSRKENQSSETEPSWCSDNIFERCWVSISAGILDEVFRGFYHSVKQILDKYFNWGLFKTPSDQLLTRHPTRRLYIVWETDSHLLQKLMVNQTDKKAYASWIWKAHYRVHRRPPLEPH